MTTRSGTGGTVLAGGLTLVGVGRETLGEGVTTFAGAGGLTVNTTIISAPQAYAGSATFAGAGLLAATGTYLQIPGALSLAGAGLQTVDAKNYGQILATFSGAGALATSAKQFVAGVYDETGSATASDTLSEVGKYTELEFGLQLDRANLVPGDVLEFRVYLDGVALDSYVTPSITVAASIWAATAAFAGAGGLSIAADITVIAGAITGTAAFAGAGQLSITPQLLMSVQESLAGAGNLAATTRMFLPSAAAFSGIGSLSVDASRLVNIWTGESVFAGIGNLTAIPAYAFLQPTAAFTGVGNLTAIPQWFRPTNAAFAGAGSLAIQATRTLNVLSELFAGTGNASIGAKMRLQPTIAFAGEGLMVADATNLAKATTASAVFAGLGNLIDIPADIYMPASAQFGGAGNFAIGGSRYIWLNEQFDGQGSLDISSDHYLAAFGIFGGLGRFADIETSIISSREYWLICSGIGIQPEILGEAAMAAAIAGEYELTTPLDGKPAVREC